MSSAQLSSVCRQQLCKMLETPVIPVVTLPPTETYSPPLPSIPRKGTLFANSTPPPPGFTWRMVSSTPPGETVPLPASVQPTIVTATSTSTPRGPLPSFKPWTGDPLPEEEEKRATSHQAAAASPPTSAAVAPGQVTSIAETPPRSKGYWTRMSPPTPGSFYITTGRPATISFQEHQDRRITRAMVRRAEFRALLAEQPPES